MSSTLTTNDADLLDVDELMHLALHNTQHQNTDKAIANLKQLLKISPEHGKANYLLGILHVELGLYDRAAKELQAAARLEPNFPIAAFQLGLLQMTLGRQSDAETSWQSLDSLGNNNPFYLFKRGILHLVEDNFQSAIADLSQGISINQDNRPLNDDMQKIIDHARQSAELTSNDSIKSQATGTQTLLSAYQRTNYSDEK